MDDSERPISSVAWNPRVGGTLPLQVGMQRRSYDLYLESRKIVADGTLGKVRMVRSWWLNNGLGGLTAIHVPVDLC
jgi:hypothetical protein